MTGSSAASASLETDPKRPVRLFTTCPPSNGVERSLYLERLIEVAKWSDDAGCTGILVYTDNGLVDPWLVAQIVIQNTVRLAPLVAVQPAYMHPYGVAKVIASLAFLHGRRVDVNWVAGGFKKDLDALGDHTPHDRRYDRLVEYATVVRRLLESAGPVTLAGEFYHLNQLKLSPAIDPGLVPGHMVSGSSAAGIAAARAIGAVAVRYPAPEEAAESGAPDVACGIRVGVIARERGAEAWDVAFARFPEDRRGQLMHQLAMKVSDSVWHQSLSARRRQGSDAGTPYWLWPFENYRTFCPYLVGDYECVGREIARYLTTGHRTVILDVPPAREELEHIGVAIRHAEELVTT
jgi:alkanesulfonate monooxygenase